MTFGSCKSPSTRRVWIEILVIWYSRTRVRSPSTRRVWIEMVVVRLLMKVVPSPSTRRVWIEINTWCLYFFKVTVTLHAEGVD